MKNNFQYLHLSSLIVLFFIFNPALAKTALNTKTWATSSGVQVVFHQANEVPLLDISIAFDAGSARDEKHFGLSELTARILDKGYGGLKPGILADQFAATGATHTTGSSQDMLTLSLRTLVEPPALSKATELFASLINNPTFSTDSLSHAKNQQLMAIKQNQESPAIIAENAFYNALYGAHPYGHPIHGDSKTVNAITLKDIQQFYQRFIVGNNAVMVLVGAIDETRAHQITEQITKGISKGTKAPAIPHATMLKQAINIDIPHPGSQTILCSGQLGITHQDKDYFPLMVGNHILGGGSLVTELAHELREKRGLTYSVTSKFSAMPGVGPFIILLSTKNSQTQAARQITHDTVDRFIKNGPSESVLTAAKHNLTGSFPQALAGNKNITNMLLRIAFYHLPENFLNDYVSHVNAVSIIDIQNAFQRHLKLANFINITVGNS